MAPAFCALRTVWPTVLTPGVPKARCSEDSRAGLRQRHRRSITELEARKYQRRTEVITTITPLGRGRISLRELGFLLDSAEASVFEGDTRSFRRTTLDDLCFDIYSVQGELRGAKDRALVHMSGERCVIQDRDGTSIRKGSKIG